MRRAGRPLVGVLRRGARALGGQRGGRASPYHGLPLSRARAPRRAGYRRGGVSTVPLLIVVIFGLLWPRRRRARGRRRRRLACWWRWRRVRGGAPHRWRAGRARGRRRGTGVAAVGGLPSSRYERIRSRTSIHVSSFGRSVVARAARLRAAWVSRAGDRPPPSRAPRGARGTGSLPSRSRPLSPDDRRTRAGMAARAAPLVRCADGRAPRVANR